MIPEELFQKIRRIEITTRRLVTDFFAGPYESVFKGKGIEFSEVREYQVGDDIRMVDWNVTARTGRLHSKRYIEERELTVMILADLSGSGLFGSVDYVKREFMAEICALLAFSALLNNDKVGLILFTDRVEKFIPPKKGRFHVLRVLRDILYFSPQGQKTDIASALRYLNELIPRRCVVFLVSDFLASNFWNLLRTTHKRHDAICIAIQDPREVTMPSVGLVEFVDAETGKSRLVDTADATFSRLYERQNRQRWQTLLSDLRKMGMDVIPLSSGQPYIEPLREFFKTRQRRRF